MSLLEECPLIKIEGILPFFSDVVTIDHFREPICQSLEINKTRNCIGVKAASINSDKSPVAHSFEVNYHEKRRKNKVWRFAD
ncbi:jg19400 [Pararge aegeria aegeria]|uniref:Jg19400 protein n=1 Tax=Pararge aegeria aegeria TaxID=348720 RepID=A0A8S4R762_9NEOP|nr:jg19400 [Pararge aegeria aegeria]